MKNFQLVTDEDQASVILQFGKVGRGWGLLLLGVALADWLQDVSAASTRPTSAGQQSLPSCAFPPASPTGTCEFWLLLPVRRTAAHAQLCEMSAL